MKYLILFSILSFVITASSKEISKVQCVDEKWKEDLPQNDIINHLVDEPFIFYSHGHNKHSWTLVVKNGNGFSAFSGSTAAENIIDTVCFQSKLMDRAFAELGKVEITDRGKKTDSFIYSEIVFRPLNTDSVLKITEPENKNFMNSGESDQQKLLYELYWLSSPEIRVKLPNPFK